MIHSCDDCFFLRKDKKTIIENGFKYGCDNKNNNGVITGVIHDRKEIKSCICSFYKNTADSQQSLFDQEE